MLIVLLYSGAGQSDVMLKHGEVVVGNGHLSAMD